MMMIDGLVIDPLIDHSISSSESEIVSLLILMRKEKERLRKKKEGDAQHNGEDGPRERLTTVFFGVQRPALRPLHE